jgi:hypothetical protein
MATRHAIVRPDEPDYDRIHITDGSPCWCDPVVEQVSADPVAPTEQPAVAALKKALARYDHELDNLIETQKILERRIVRIRLDATRVNEQRVELLAAINQVLV